MKVGTIFMSSKLSANIAFSNPPNENNIAVSIITNRVKNIFWTTISVKNKDVIKTRIQNKDFKEKVRGGEIVKNIVKREGIGAFFKGIGPKLLTIGPKLTFSFTVAQYFIQYFDDMLNKQN